MTCKDCVQLLKSSPAVALSYAGAKEIRVLTAKQARHQLQVITETNEPVLAFSYEPEDGNRLGQRIVELTEQGVVRQLGCYAPRHQLQSR